MARSLNDPVNPGYTIINGTCNGTRGYRGDVWVEYKEEGQDIAANKTRIAAYCYTALNEAYDTAYCNNSRGMYSNFKVNNVSGINLKDNGSYNFREHTPMLLGSYDDWITHNSDGTKSITVNGNFTTDALNISDGSVSGSITLETIPRATTPTVSDMTMGEENTINLSPKNQSFTHTLRYKFGSAPEGTIAAKTTDKTPEWNPSEELAEQIPSTTSGTCTIICDTYSASTKIGTKSVNCKLSVPDGMEPYFIEDDPLNPPIKVDKKSGNSSVYGWNEFVKGYSTAKLTANAGAEYSNIISYRFEVRKGDPQDPDNPPKVLYSSTQSTSEWECGLLRESCDDLKFFVEVTDSRGRKASYTTEAYTVYDYKTPYVSEAEVFRCDSEGIKDLADGTYISAKGKFNASSVVGNNQIISRRIEYREYGDTTWILGQDGAQDDSVYMFGEGTIDKQHTYEVKLTVTDSVYGSVSTVHMIKPGFVTMHVKTGGKGVGFGGAADLDELQTYMPFKAKDMATFEGDVNIPPYKLKVNGTTLEDMINGGAEGTLIPVGTIMMWTSGTVPDGWMLCDGGSKDRIFYGELFGVIGTTYGSSDSQHFNVPNLKGSFPFGATGSLGETGGAATHTLLESEMPAHSHTVNSHAHTINHSHGTITTTDSSISLGYSEDKRYVSYNPDDPTYYMVEDVNETSNHTHNVPIPNYTGDSGDTAPSTNSKGSGTAHNNMPPYITVNFIIAYRDVKVPFKGDKGDKGDKGYTGDKGDNAPLVQYQFSVDGMSWHSAFAAGDAYLRFSCDDGSSWGDAIFFKGEQGVQGIQGEKGDTGDKGDKGDTGEQGICLRCMGAWGAGTQYVNNSSYIDAVEHNGSSYTCKLTHTGQEPPNAAYWDLAAHKGDTGEQGEKGTSFRHLGAWDSATEYVFSSLYIDVVESNGSGYACKTTHTGQEPPNAVYWELVALKGLDGTGSGDVLGPSSSVDANVAVFDSTTGKVIKDSGGKLSDYLPKTGGTFTGDVTAPRLRLTAADDASETSTAHALQIGTDGASNIIIDNNEIIARNNGAYNNLYINGSKVQIGGGTFQVLGESTFNDRVNMNKPLQVTYTDRVYSAYISTSSTTNEYIFGGSDASDFSANRYIRIGDNKLQYSYQDSSDVWHTHDVYHSGNLTPSNYLPLSGGTITGNIAMSNNNITGVNLLAINDEGPTEGISFTGGGSGTTYLNRVDDENLRIVTPNGYIDLGPKNTSTCHIYTDRGTFYFNKNLQVNGDYVRLKYGSDRKSYTLAANTNLSVSISEGETVYFEIADRFSGDLCMYINGDTNLGNYKSIYYRSGGSSYTQRNFVTFCTSTSYAAHAQGKIFVLDGDVHISGQGMRGESIARLGTFEIWNEASSVSSIRFDKQVEITLTKVNYG